MRRLFMVLLVGGVFLSTQGADAAGPPSVRTQYWPLSNGREWIYSVSSSILDSVIREDTIRVDDVVWRRGRAFYHLSTPWFPLFDVWMRPDRDGDLYWCGSPGQAEYPLLLFSAEVGSGWLLGGRHCMDSAVRVSCHLLVQNTIAPAGDVSCFAGEWRPGDCCDAYWYGEIAEGVGPVVWQLIGAGGAAITWQLTKIRPRRHCDCKCHADPFCDGVLNVLDVVITIDVVFRGRMPKVDRGCWCYAHRIHSPTDANCDGVTNVIDVVKFVSVAFRDGDAGVEFREGCP